MVTKESVYLHTNVTVSDNNHYLNTQQQDAQLAVKVTLQLICVFC